VADRYNEGYAAGLEAAANALCPKDKLRDATDGGGALALMHLANAIRALPIPAAQAHEEAQPMVACPKCGREYQDFDGFGVVFCESCGYCRHFSRDNGKCNYCGNVRPAAQGTKEKP
jgi:hypothetical protein